MIQAMQSAIAGLKSHQTKMDVIGNNIANVNTWGYKTKSANFSDSMYQNYINGSAATGTLGGVDVSQVGFGSQVSSITSNFETGGMFYTGNSFDCMIDGPGFFIVGNMINDVAGEGFDLGADESATVKGSGLFLSRVGIFKTPDGYLTDDQGNYIYGYAADNTTPGDTTDVVTTRLVPLTIPEGAKSVAIMQDGTISVTMEDDTVQVAGRIAIATVENTGGLEQSAGYLYTMGANVGDLTLYPDSTGGGAIQSGYLEMPNVDLATEMANMITTQRGYQANTKMITVTDEMLSDLVSMKR